LSAAGDTFARRKREQYSGNSRHVAKGDNNWLPSAGDDAAKNVEELRQQGAATAADLQAAESEPKSYWKQLLTPYKVRLRLRQLRFDGRHYL